MKPEVIDPAKSDKLEVKSEEDKSDVVDDRVKI